MAFFQCLQFFAIRKIIVPVGVEKLHVQRFSIAIQIEQNGAKRRDANSSGDEHKVFPAMIHHEITAPIAAFNNIARLELFQCFLERTALGHETGREHHLFFVGCGGD